MSDHSILDTLIRKFELRGPLGEDDRRALRSLPFQLRTMPPHAYVSREGDEQRQSCLLLSGFAYRQKLTVEGARQIVSVHIPGDFVDLENALLRVADHNVQALTRCEFACIPVEAIEQLIATHPRLARSLWIDTLIDASIFREWVMNVGRRDARSRIAHLLCEFARRLEGAGLAEEYRYELPMTQEQLADATGLTPVHVNRVLKALESDGLIVREKRFVRIPSWESLRREAGFSDRYLHLATARPSERAPALAR